MEQDILELLSLAVTPPSEGEEVYTGGGSGFSYFKKLGDTPSPTTRTPVTTEPQGKSYIVDFDLPETQGFKGVIEKELEQPTGNSPDPLGFFLQQKNMQEAKLKPQPLRPTKIGQKFKDLPTVSIKEYTEVLPVSSTRKAWRKGEKGEQEIWSTDALKELSALKKGEVVDLSSNEIGITPKVDLAHYTLSAGRDDQGVYVSVFDVWDFEGGYETFYMGKQGFLEQMRNPLKSLQPAMMQAVGNPFAIYDRYYIPDTDIEMELERRQQALAMMEWE
jgi:hypothetical protein